MSHWLNPGLKSKGGTAWRGLEFFIPRPKAYALPLLFDTNVLIFVAMALAGVGFIRVDSDDLLAWGANYRPALHGFGLFRLVSSQFVHAGVIQLLNNMHGLLFAGIFLAGITGNPRLIFCYLVTGFFGSIASAVIHPATVSVGTSGAIFGLFGILLRLSALNDKRLEGLRRFVLINMGIFVSINLLIGAGSSGIDNAAHLGGLTTGVVLGLLLRFTKFGASRGEPLLKHGRRHT